MAIKNIEKEYDLICVGGGIMSATLALMLNTHPGKARRRGA